MVEIEGRRSFSAYILEDCLQLGLVFFMKKHEEADGSLIVKAPSRDRLDQLQNSRTFERESVYVQDRNDAVMVIG